MATRPHRRPQPALQARASRQQAAVNLVGTWNVLCGSGTPVSVSLVEGGPRYATKTRGLAWAVGDTAWILVEGIMGGVPLAWVKPLDNSSALPAVPEDAQIHVSAPPAPIDRRLPDA